MRAPPPPARRALRAAALLLVLAAAALGDVIHLKDGSRVSGKVLSESARLVRVRTEAGRIEAIRKSDIERIEKGVDLDEDEARAERDRQWMPGLDLATRQHVISEAKRFGDPMGVQLKVAATPHAYVFGDHPEVELLQVAQAVEKTYLDFVRMMGCEPDAPLPGRKVDEAGQFYVFQFKQEPMYLRFVDRVFDRLRDETVDDRRLALIRRQRGFWIISPRALMGHYQGPGMLQGVVSHNAHKASHAMMLMYRPAGAWMPWWFLEGVATWQEIRLTGFNLTYCIEVSQPGGYAKEGVPDADEAAKAKTQKRWRKKVKALVRIGDDKDLATLGRLHLNEIVLQDVMQSWSIVEWLSDRRKLVAFTHAYKDHRDLDAACQQVFGKPAAGVHQDWRKWVRQTYR